MRGHARRRLLSCRLWLCNFSLRHRFLHSHFPNRRLRLNHRLRIRYSSRIRHNVRHRRSRFYWHFRGRRLCGQRHYRRTSIRRVRFCIGHGVSIGSLAEVENGTWPQFFNFDPIPLR